MNTHEKYKTVAHHHFDFVFATEAGGDWEYPDSGLMLVQCANGDWFIQQEFGDEYDHFSGVVKSRNDLDTNPTFYGDLESAAKAAFALIKKVYPSTPDERLDDFLNS